MCVDILCNFLINFFLGSTTKLYVRDNKIRFEKLEKHLRIFALKNISLTGQHLHSCNQVLTFSHNATQ